MSKLHTFTTYSSALGIEAAVVQTQPYHFEVGGGDRRKPPHRLQNDGLGQTDYKRIARPNTLII